jgi:DNA polymerase
MFDKALAEVGIDRSRVYVTNAVKHFKWAAARQAAAPPEAELAEMTACRPWLDAELGWCSPRVLVCLGATAAQALLGRAFRVTKQRGLPVDSPLAEVVVATIHPSAILRRQ